MTKLTDTQSVVLFDASQRQDCKIFPLPASLTANKGAMTRVINTLVRKGLVDEVPAKSDDEIWREAGDQPFTLIATSKGLDAIGVVDARGDLGVEDINAGAGSYSAKTLVPTNNCERKSTKQSQVIELLQQTGGVSISELMQTTGWQAHSVRGFISGTAKKKLGLSVTSQTVEARGRVYSITVSA